MKILRIISSMNPASGGPCQGVRNSIPALSQLEIENVVLCLNEQEAEFLVRDEFETHALGPGKTPWQYNRKLYNWLREHLQRFDAVIVHGLWQYPGFAIQKVFAELVKRGKQPPKLFVMPHGMLDPYFQKAKGRRLKAVRNILYWKFIESKLIQLADGVLFTCEEEMLLARKTFSNYNPKREINTGYGIPAPPDYTNGMREALERNCPKLKERPYLLFLSRIDEKKGVDLLIDAYIQVHESKLQNIPLLVIAGPGQETSYGKQLQMKLNAFPRIKEHVLFTGMLTGEAKWGAFYGCEAFVLPSHQENFGIAIVEALACGKPVLVSDKVNIWRELAKGGGAFVEKDDLQGTVQLLQGWLNLNEEQKRSMGEKAQQTYNRQFAIESTAARLVQVLQDNVRLEIMHHG